MSFIKKTFYIEEKMKLFIFLMREFKISQREAQRWVDKGRICTQGARITEKGASVEGEIEVLYFRPDSCNLSPLFITPSFAIFDKPADLLVHPRGTFAHYTLIDEVRFCFGNEANLVHRIDKETSGIVLISRDRRSDLELKNSFKEHEVKKRYLALVRGRIASKMELHFPILAQDKRQDLGIRMKIDRAGKPSFTHITPLCYDLKSDTTLISAEPLTGRTHQIRVHLAHAGFPIVGDPLYGANDEDSRAYLERKMPKSVRERCFGASRLMLHAEYLNFNFKNNIYEIYSKQDFIEEVEAVQKLFKNSKAE